MTIQKVYTGIGSRQLPNRTKDLMTNIGTAMAYFGWTLRSGGAEGSDSAFESGCDKVQGRKEIFLPWPGYNQKQGIVRIPEEAYNIASRHHPKWGAFSGKKSVYHKLLARNVLQILGLDLNSPTECVICYTPDGCVNGASRTVDTGGTGLAISVASEYNIPVFNLQTTVGYKHFIQFVSQYF